MNPFQVEAFVTGLMYIEILNVLVCSTQVPKSDKGPQRSAFVALHRFAAQARAPNDGDASVAA